LYEGKIMHDKIESLYNPHIDFDKVYNLADKIADDILK